MTDQDTQGQSNDDETSGAAGKPSQAEGERNPGSSQDMDDSAGGKPSQAEGDRETIDAELNES